MSAFQTFEGKPQVLGAVPFNDGVNFAVYSKNATRVVLDLFDSAIKLHYKVEHNLYIVL